MNICLLAAGAGGMYCGSCLRDNTLAKALLRLGHKAMLVPLYTPLRTDSETPAIGKVFYGGVNVYLQHATRLFRRTPRFVDWLFDRPWLLRWAGSRGAQTSPRQLGELVLGILAGEHGPQVKELRRLVEFLRQDLRPDIVSLPSAMFIGMARMIRQQTGAAVICELTGEDIFLDAMAEPYRTRAREAMAARVGDVSGFVATSRYYATKMADYLGAARDRIDVVYPGVEGALVAGSTGIPASAPVGRRPSAVGSGEAVAGEHEDPIQNPKSKVQDPPAPPVIGYLARICPEKGIDRLVDALPHLRAMPGMANVKVRAAGYLGAAHRGWFEELQKRIGSLGLNDAFEYVGEVDLSGKLAHLDSTDVLCVPTAYAEPKGIFALEAMARGTPVVLPAHGAFPEMIEHTGGGVLVRPGDAPALAGALADLLRDSPRRESLGAAGRAAVRERFTDEHMARQMLRIYEAARGRAAG